MTASVAIQTLLPGEIIVDSFAGGGGASLAIEIDLPLFAEAAE